MKNIIKIGDMKIGEGIPKICVPIVGKTKIEILNTAQRIKVSEADFVEWRADFFEYVSEWVKIEEVLQSLRDVLVDMPLLFTIRTFKEGGNVDISLEDYFSINCAAIKSKLIDLVDIEFFQDRNVVRDLIKKAREFNVYTIISNHDFEKTPTKNEIIKRMCEMQNLNGDILKIALMPKEKRDVLVLLDSTEEVVRTYADRPIIAISMGQLGVISRITGSVFGSSVTFGTVEEQSAPGQLPVEDLKLFLKMLSDIHV